MTISPVRLATACAIVAEMPSAASRRAAPVNSPGEGSGIVVPRGRRPPRRPADDTLVTITERLTEPICCRTAGANDRASPVLQNDQRTIRSWFLRIGDSTISGEARWESIVADVADDFDDFVGRCPTVRAVEQLHLP